MSSIPVFDISNPLGGLLDQAVAMGYVNEKRTTTKGAVASFEDNIEHAVSIKADIDPTLDGVSAVNITTAGKNIFNPDKAVADSTGVTKNNGWLEFTTNGDNRIYYKGLKLPRCAFTVICKSDNSNTNRIQLTAIYSDGTNSTIGEVTTTDTNEHTFTGTTTANKTLVELRTGYTNSIKSYIKICMVIGSTPVSYEPYAGDTATISLGSTVYGGSVSISEEGAVELTETFKHVDLGSLTWQAADPSFGENAYSAVLTGNGGAVKQTLCENYTVVDSKADLLDMCIYPYNNGSTIFIKNAECETADDMKTALNGIYIVYYNTGTPTVTELTDIDPIETLVGENNIWADTGDIEVGYFYQLYQPI